MSKKYLLDDCAAGIKDNKLVISITDEEITSPVEPSQIYSTAISALYLYILTQVDNTYTFTSYDLSAVTQYLPRMACVLDIEVFEYFIKNPADLFVMLEVLTLQAMYLKQEDGLVDISHFQNLEQKVIAKTREHKDIVLPISQDDIKDLETVFKAFDGEKLAHVEFESINNMISKPNITYETLNQNHLVDLVHQVTKQYNQKINAYEVYLNGLCIYQIAIS